MWSVCRCRWRISIHALREEGDRRGEMLTGLYRISIHALREEGDYSAGKADSSMEWISIHALREEGDLKRFSSAPAL